MCDLVRASSNGAHLNLGVLIREQDVMLQTTTMNISYRFKLYSVILESRGSRPALPLENMICQAGQTVSTVEKRAISGSIVVRSFATIENVESIRQVLRRYDNVTKGPMPNFQAFIRVQNTKRMQQKNNAQKVIYTHISATPQPDQAPPTIAVRAQRPSSAEYANQGAF